MIPSSSVLISGWLAAALALSLGGCFGRPKVVPLNAGVPSNSGAFADSPRDAPTQPADQIVPYTVQPGDTLSAVAARHGTTVEALLALNGMADADAILVGQELRVEAVAEMTGPNLRALPDAAIPNGPSSSAFDVAAYVAAMGGRLANHTEPVDGVELTGGQILTRIAREYSVAPRTLLAIIEARSGWLTGEGPPELAEYPAGLIDPVRAGLWWQASWLANELNEGYYGAKTRGRRQFGLLDGTIMEGHPDLNPGSIAVHRALAAQTEAGSLEAAITDFSATYKRLFGDPWLATPPVANLEPFPQLALAWGRDETWFFTGGPHGGWGGGSAWAALDFVPPGEERGCYVSTRWATAVADGVIVDGGPGVLWLDLDGDGHPGTGPAVLYLHLASEDRVLDGARVSAGNPIGHPSCEGGSSSATHLHIARMLDGEWLPAAGPSPFDMGTWRAGGGQAAYDGTLERRDGQTRSACECWEMDVNGIDG